MIVNINSNSKKHFLIVNGSVGSDYFLDLCCDVSIFMALDLISVHVPEQIRWKMEAKQNKFGK